MNENEKYILLYIETWDVENVSMGAIRGEKMHGNY